MNDRSSFLRRTIVAMLTACMSVTLSIPSFATTVDEAQAKKAEAEENLNTVNNEISNITNEQEELQSQIYTLDTELDETLSKIEILKSEIAEKTIELDRDRANLADAKAAEKEQYRSMKDRICYMYENGGSSLLEAILGGGDFASILNKVDNFEAMYGFDRSLLENYMEARQEVENLVGVIEQEEHDLEEYEIQLELQQTKLEQEIADKNIENANLAQKLTEEESLALQYQSTISEMDNVIAIAQTAYNTETITPEITEQVTSTTSTQATGISYKDTIVYSGSGSAVVDYACQFVGNPYVWGGTSLTNGCDCSGFVMSVYAHFGVSLPHSSYSLRSVGYAVSASEMQPGDIICYDGHCAIYIGGGAIVHASNSKDGIIISSDYAYRTVLAIRRVF